MQNDANKEINNSESKKVNRLLVIILSVLLLVLLLGWAVSTVLEIEMMKALAFVVLGAVGAAIALLMAGIS